MAETNYGGVATPRIWIDYIQYAKAIGMVGDFLTGNGLSGSTVDPSLAWDFNPTRMTSYEITNSSKVAAFRVNMNYRGTKEQYQFRRLLSTANYGMILGLDGSGVTKSDDTYSRFEVKGDVTGNGQDDHNSGVEGLDTIVGVGALNGTDWINTAGYSIQTFDGFYSDDDYNFDRIVHVLYNKGNDDTDGLSLGDVIKIGTFSFGKYFDLPHSANLSIKQTIAYDGVKTKRTIGGADLTQVNYTRPKWGDLASWTSVNRSDYVDSDQGVLNADYSNAGFQGRRSWDLAFSYISKEDMFPRTFHNNSAGYYDLSDTQEFDSNADLHNDNVVGNWINLTLSGQIPFVFQPDKTKNSDFAIVRIDKPSLSIEQVAYQVYDFSVRLIEVF